MSNNDDAGQPIRMARPPTIAEMNAATAGPQPRLKGGHQVSASGLPGVWRAESAGYVEPIRHVLLTCAAELEAALLLVDDPDAYAGLTAGVLPPPAPADPDAVMHAHGAHGMHWHSAADYAAHQKPIEDERFGAVEVEQGLGVRVTEAVD